VSTTVAVVVRRAAFYYHYCHRVEQTTYICLPFQAQIAGFKELIFIASIVARCGPSSMVMSDDP
jgi:hypothetical protein